MAGRHTRRIKILHVDDDASFGELVSQFLSQGPEEIDSVIKTRATDGLEYLRNGDGDIDCIVSDYALPDMNGIEFLRDVREEYPDLPFILFTGKGSEQVASDAITSGVSDYLQKQGGTAQYAILTNRIRNLVELYTTQARIARYDLQEQEDEQAHQRLLEITGNREISISEKVRRLLELGVDYLSVENGHLVTIQPEEGRHEVVIASGSDIVRKGVTDLSETYCRRTIDSEDMLDVYDAPAQGWDGDPAYERFGIGCYIGKKLEIGDDLYGTVCFVDKEPRDEPFSRSQKVFFDLLSRSLTELLVEAGGELEE